MRNRTTGVQTMGKPGTVVKHDNERTPTHFAVPVPVFEAVRKTLMTLPYEQVAVLMSALAECQGMAIQQNSE